MNNENEILMVWINGSMKFEEGILSRELNSWGMKWCLFLVFYLENLYMLIIYFV